VRNNIAENERFST